MHFGLFISIVMHAAILGWAFITIQSQRELRVPEPEPIVTGLVTEGELTKLRQGARTAKQLEAADQGSAQGRRGQEGSRQAQAGGGGAAGPSASTAARVRHHRREARGGTPSAATRSCTPPPPPPPAADEQKKREAMLQEQAGRLRRS